MKESKIILLDTETTGVDFKKNHLWQIAGYVIINDEIVEEFDIKVRPPKDTEYSAGALKKTRMTVEDFAKLPSNKKGFEEFISLLQKYVNKFDKKDKFFVCAYNAHFDVEFIRQWFGMYKGSFYGSYFWSNPIDIMTLAAEFLKSIRPAMPSFKLSTVYRTLVVIGLLVDKDLTSAHDALFDIEIEHDIYNLFKIENIRSTLDKVDKLLN